MLTGAGVYSQGRRWRASHSRKVGRGRAKEKLRGGDLWLSSRGGGRGRHQAVVQQPLVIVDLGQVLDAEVREDGDDRGVLVERARELKRREEVEPRRPAGADALLAAEHKARVEGILVRHGDHLVDEVKVHGARDRALAHALDQKCARLGQGARAKVLGEDRAHGVAQHHAHVRVHLLEVATRSGDGAAGGAGRHKVGDAAGGLLPDLRAERKIVALRVALRLVLVHVKVEIWVLEREQAGHLHVVRGLALLGAGRRDEELGAVGADGVHLLLAAFWRGGDDALVAAHSAHHGGGGAGVAAGSGDDGHAGAKAALGLGLVQDVLDDAVLD
mmetsp:Transcript_22378/g.71571  ORF Transcript_22378/g.71571 Transcript_22378/m.71571 type:complete len:330 (+) Transcript_22378:33-1022(+)